MMGRFDDRLFRKAVNCVTTGFLIATCAFVTPALADDPDLSPGSVTFRTDSGWTFFPGTKDCSVVGFIARQDDGEPAPNGYTVVWYHRLEDGSYEMMGWDGDAKSLAAFLREEFGEPELFPHSELAADCEVVAQDQSTPMQHGLSIFDPFQAIAPYLTPQEMELLVASGARGARVLSAQSLNTAGAGTCDDVTAAFLENAVPLVEEFMCGEVKSEPGCESAICRPGTVEFKWWGAPTWNPHVYTCVNPPGCKYTGTRTEMVRTCQQRWDCSLYNCTTAPGTTEEVSKICPMTGPGECPPPPPPC